MTPYKTYKTERLFLRPTLEEDAEFILALLNTPKWLEYIGDRNVKTKDEARQYIQVKMLPQLEKLGFGNYTLIRKSDNQKMGTCGLYDRPGFEDIDIGFAMLPAYEKKGYAYEAAKRIKEAAQDDFGIKSISGMTTKENVASQKLLQKLGMELTGTTKLPDEDEELLLYRMEL